MDATVWFLRPICRVFAKGIEAESSGMGMGLVGILIQIPSEKMRVSTATCVKLLYLCPVELFHHLMHEDLQEEREREREEREGEERERERERENRA